MCSWTLADGNRERFQRRTPNGRPFPPFHFGVPGLFQHFNGAESISRRAISTRAKNESGRNGRRIDSIARTPLRSSCCTCGKRGPALAARSLPRGCPHTLLPVARCGRGGIARAGSGLAASRYHYHAELLRRLVRSSAAPGSALSARRRLRLVERGVKDEELVAVVQREPLRRVCGPERRVPGGVERNLERGV